MLGRVIPLAVALEIGLTGDRIDAARALSFGLVNRVVPADQVLDEAVALASRIAQNGPLGVQATKRLMRDALDVDPEELWERQRALSASVFASDDAKKGLARSSRSASRTGRGARSEPTRPRLGRMRGVPRYSSCDRARGSSRTSRCLSRCGLSRGRRGAVRARLPWRKRAGRSSRAEDDRRSCSAPGLAQGDAETVAGQGCEHRIASLGCVVQERVVHLERTLEFAAVDEHACQAGAAHAPHGLVSLLMGE